MPLDDSILYSISRLTVSWLNFDLLLTVSRLDVDSPLAVSQLNFDLLLTVSLLNLDFI